MATSRRQAGTGLLLGGGINRTRDGLLRDAGGNVLTGRGQSVKIRTNLDSFAFRIREMRNLVPDRIDANLRALALRFLRRVIQGTPVDTGRARSNWQVTFGRPADGEVRGGRVDRGGNAALSSGQARLRARILGTEVFFTNNVPYILRLERGWSNQNRAFIGRAAQQALREYRRLLSADRRAGRSAA